MSALTRFERMDNLLADPFPDLMRRFFRGTDLPALRTPAEIRVDVSEDDKAYTVKAEIPGAKKDDVRVQIDRNYVSISAEVKEESETEDKDKRVLTRELYYGSMARSFGLAREVNEKEAQAQFKDGVLTLTLPKRADATSTSLRID